VIVGRSGSSHPPGLSPMPALGASRSTSALVSAQGRSVPQTGSRPVAAVNSLAVQVPVRRNPRNGDARRRAKAGPRRAAAGSGGEEKPDQPVSERPRVPDVRGSSSVRVDQAALIPRSPDGRDDGCKALAGLSLSRSGCCWGRRCWLAPSCRPRLNQAPAWLSVVADPSGWEEHGIAVVVTGGRFRAPATVRWYVRAHLGPGRASRMCMRRSTAGCTRRRRVASARAWPTKWQPRRFWSRGVA
jgi:hypothetical protein